jgi:hypothetical protein
MPGPRFQFSTAIAAGATVDLFATSIYRYLPFSALVELYAWTTAAGVFIQLLAGSELIQPESPIDFGAPAAGRMPTPFNVSPLTFEAAAADLLQVLARNSTAGPLTVSGFIDLTPTG